MIVNFNKQKRCGIKIMKKTMMQSAGTAIQYAILAI